MYVEKLDGRVETTISQGPSAARRKEQRQLAAPLPGMDGDFLCGRWRPTPG